MFTSYSRIQNETERIRKNLLRTTRAIAYSGFPLFFGMAAVAPEGIPMLLGARWTDLVVPFQLFCLVMPLRALSHVLSPAIFAMGRPDIHVGNGIISLFGMSIAIIIGAKFGLKGVCLAWIIVFPFIFLINSIRCLKIVGISLSEFFSEMKFPLFATLLMVGIISITRASIHLTSTAYLFSIMIVLGTVCYILLLCIFKKDEIIRIKELMKTIK